MKVNKKTRTIKIESCYKCPFLITKSKHVWSGWEGYCELYDIVADELVDFEVGNDKYIWHKCPLGKQSFIFVIDKNK